MAVGQPFKAIVMLEQETSPDWRMKVSRWLVSSGCLHMMAWGQSSSLWDDSVDLANLELFNSGEIPDDQYVMTTWHEKEALSETLWFAENAAHHPAAELRETLLLHIAETARQAELLKAHADANLPR